MRCPGRVLLVVTLLVTSPSHGWSCIWVRPVDPCTPWQTPQPEPKPERSEEPVELTGGQASLMMEETVEVVAEEEREEEGEEALGCGEICRRIDASDPELRQRTYEEIEDGLLDHAQCPQAIEGLQRVLRDESDDFLVFRALAALGHLVDDPDTLLPLLDHRSGDVRRKAAELLAGEVFEPEAAARVMAAILREGDPWNKIALTALWPEGYEDEVTALLAGIIEAGGPTAAAAMAQWDAETDGYAPLLTAMRRPGPVRGAAILVLGSQAENEAVRAAFLKLLEEGTSEERVHTAAALLSDSAATEASAWKAAVLDQALPVQSRAGLVLHASLQPEWIPVACEAKRADPELETVVGSLLASEDKHLGEAMELPLIPWQDFEHPDGGTLRTSGGVSERCATRPSGPPPADGVRIRDGETVYAPERFTVDGVEWRMANRWCWLRADRIVETDPGAEKALVPVAEALEMDVPTELLPSLHAAIAAGDLQVFDPIPGFAGIRVVAPTDGMRQSWDTGEGGRRSVLARVEAEARLWESLRRQQ